ncbi:heparin lyase I family protein [Zobellia nedashkovskayae]|uniref:heparin lyase I family protein n=1 Tax=Zobellia nedashkovskayae TaxID=2779510 RepID=UPI00188C2B93|nr:heparin lyase I family protein [Zobellia nedashkovskayae]
MIKKILFLIVFLLILCCKQFAFTESSTSVFDQFVTQKLVTYSSLASSAKNSSDAINLNFITDSLNSKDKCSTKNGGAGEIGLKVFCWSDISLEESNDKTKRSIDSLHLKIDTECNPDQVKIDKGKLSFHVELESTISNKNCERQYNMRAEVRTAPWNVNHVSGTEEWFGWNYTFNDDYKIDKQNPWLFFQVHEGTLGDTPLIALWCMNQDGPGSGRAGEIHVVNNAHTSKSYYNPSGFVPKAGETLDIVVHVVWGDYSNGLLQVWINGEMVHNKNQRTVRASNPVGGNAKWGIYKWKWANKEGVERSKEQDIFSVSTSMGPLRIITRKPDTENYLKSSYLDVAPR